jgi:hypothetical protein
MRHIDMAATNGHMIKSETASSYIEASVRKIRYLPLPGSKREKGTVGELLRRKNVDNTQKFVTELHSTWATEEFSAVER